MIYGVSLEWLPVMSSVPLLFILYINELPSCLFPGILCAIYADDTKIYREISGKEDQTKLHKDINNLKTWGDKWGLKFNAKKCEALSIHGHLDKQEYQHKMNDQDLEVVDKMSAVT